MKTSVIILLAGSSTRFKSSVKKQFFEINNKPLFYYSINCFERAKSIDEIVLVVEKELIEYFKQSILTFGFNKVVKIIEGGNERQRSVNNGLMSLECEDDDIVLIHDGARPLVPESIINNCIQSAKKHNAITTAIKVEDTIALSKDGIILDFPNRESLWRVQTPQAFQYSLIKQAHKEFENQNFTDDAQLVKKLGKDIKIVEGSKIMIKITTIEDINFVKEYIENE